MTKKQTQIIKGVAILMMIFLHLFSPVDKCLNFQNILCINGIPLATILTRACRPVPFFLFLGGYGLYCVNINADKHHYSRILKLYINYWLVLTIFFIIGHFIVPEKFILSPIEFLKNASSIYYDYNVTYWFLFPYMILSISFPVLYKLIQRYNPIIILIVSFVLSICASIIIYKYGESFIYNNTPLNDIISIFSLSFPFTVGAITKHYDLIHKIQTYLKPKNLLTLLLLVSVIILKCVFQTTATDSFYAITIIFLICSINIPEHLSYILKYLGNNSMNMWFTHYCFIILFPTAIFNLNYPVLAFVVLVLISLASSLLITAIATPLTNLVQKKWTILSQS